ncbi:MAG: aldolase [Hyphomicrobiaceae bacterium]|nr:aldolase [Hyphomicrobiaceae bacterium]
MTATNPLRRRLEEGRTILGVWQQLSHPAVAELVALAGYDMVLIDLEHGPGSLFETANMMRGIAGTGSSAMVRVPANDPVILKRLLDQGPDGVMIPMVESADEACAAVAACRYPPKGRRGWAAGVARAARYGFDRDYTLKTASELVIACQIESVAGVRDVDAIAAVEGVDVIFVGRNDLAADAGHILDLDHPEVDAMLYKCLEAARRNGKKAGTVPSARRNWQSLFSDGFDMVVPSSDISFIRDGASAELDAYRRYLADRGEASIGMGGASK